MKKKIVVFLLLGGVCIAEAAYGDCSGIVQLPDGEVNCRAVCRLFRGSLPL